MKLHKTNYLYCNKFANILFKITLYQLIFSLKNRFFEIYYKCLKLKMNQYTLKYLQIKKRLSCKLHT